MADAASRTRAHPGFVRFWTAATLSDFGSAITALALQLLILVTLGGTTTDVGLVSGARWVAYPLLGLVAGLWIDRLRRRPVLIASDLGRGVLLATICGLALTGHLGIVGLALLIGLFGLLSLANDAAAQSILSHLVPPRLLVRANARLEQSTAVASTTGPALAGLLITVVLAPVAMLVDAVSYLVSGAVTATVVVDEQPPHRDGRRSARVEIVEGLRWAYGHPTLGPLSRNSHGWFLAWAVLITVQVSYALSLGFDAFTLGIVFAVGGIATLVGTSASESLIRRWGEGRVISVSRWGYAPGVGLALLASLTAAPDRLTTPTALVFGLAQVVIGLGFGAEGPAELAYRQAVTPARLQGRTNTTLRSVNRTMIVIGAPLGGLLAAQAGPRTALLVALLGFVVVAVWFGRTAAASVRFDPDAEAA